jgi:cytochrome c-type biogenesis protein CcmH/NrfG
MAAPFRARQSGGAHGRREPELTMRFCPQCGTPSTPGARFCVECGGTLTEAETGSDAPGVSARAPVRGQPSSGITARFVAVFAGVVIIGLVIAGLVLRHLPQREHDLAVAKQQAANEAQGLPPGHPRIKLPEQAKQLIAGLEAKARANPEDIKAWTQFGNVSMRASVFDPSYYDKAIEAFNHVLKLNPDNLDALHGVGDYDYDHGKYDEAIAAYEHYLSKKPDDPDVRTDLGTMYLQTGNADQAIVQYRKVLAKNPKFFQAVFNMGIAYEGMNNMASAREAFEQALKLSPDDQTRKQVNRMLAQLDSAAEGGQAASSGPPAEAPNAANAAAAKPATFEGAMEQMLRGLPVAGSRVQTVQWPSKTKVRVLLDNFPMDKMPPFMATKFMGDLKTGVKNVEASYKVTGPIQVDLCDAASGRVMGTVKQ